MTEPTPDPTPTQSASPTPNPTFEQRMERFGDQAGATGERIGKQAEAFGQRIAKDPSVSRAADTAARFWGLIVLAVGLWFLADVTMGMDMAAVPWGDVWPLGLILLSGLMVFRGMGPRRSA